MIPKVIHYCWFGRGPKPDIVRKCLDSWYENCNGYEIIEWNEDNYDINKHPYIQQAYQEEKWAFVSDYARLDIIFNYGGIYIDTDVEFLAHQEDLDKLIGYKEVFVFQNARGIATGLFFASEKNNDILKQLLLCYDSISEKAFLSCVVMNRPVFVNYYTWLKWNCQTQINRDSCFLGQKDYSRLMKHYGTKSWVEDLPTYSLSGDMWLKRFLRDPKKFEQLEKNRLTNKLVPVYTFIAYDFLDLGLLYFCKTMYKKIKKKLYRKQR